MTPSSRAEEIGAAEVYDLILEVKRGRETLSTAVIGLEKDERYFLPMSSLAGIVQFKADTDIRTGTISGFVIAPENTYRINVKEKTYTLKGKTLPLPEGEAFVFEQGYGVGDVYVTPEFLNQIWPLDVRLNTLKLTLDIKTEQKLPYQLVAERQRKRDRRLRNKDAQADGEGSDGLPFLKNEYKRLSLPALDITNTLGWQSRDGKHTETLNVSGQNDLFRTQANYNFRFENESGKNPSLQDARILLTRKAFSDGDLPFGLKLFQAGDVSSQSARLIDGSIRGRGIVFTNAAQKQAGSFDTITVEGVTHPGWEVELYRNRELIGFQAANERGEYRFEDVTLNYNKTVIRAVIYGPEGQVEEREETYNIARNMLKPGQTVYEAGLMDYNRDVISTEENTSNADGLAQNYRISRGINKWLSTFGTFTGLPTQQGDRRYVTIGFNLALFGLSGSVEGYKDLSHGSAIDVRFAGNFAGINLNFGAAFLSDFENEKVGFGDKAEVQTLNISADKSIKLPVGTLGLRINIDRDKFRDDSSRTRIDTSQSYSVNKLRFTHGTNTTLTDGGQSNTNGRLSATYNITPDWRLRSLLNYDATPEWGMRDVLGELRYKDKQGFTAALNVDKNLQNKGIGIGAQIGYEFDKFRSSIDLDRDPDGEYRTLLRTSFSLAPYGDNRDYTYSARNLSNKAALNARVFLDRDYDGKYGPGDEPLQNVRLKVGKRQTGASNKDGYIYYVGSPKNEYEDITLDFSTLDGPFMTSETEGFRTLLRPGLAPFIEFPVIETGTIDGTLSTGNGPLGGVNIQLLSQNGEVLETVQTAFDGFYVFEFIRPGSYEVRIDPSYEEIRVPPRSVSVTSENLFPTGMDFQILEQAEEAACVEKAEHDGRITQLCHDTPSSTPGGTEEPAQLLDRSIEYAAVTRVRIGEHPEKLRITLDLSAPTGYSVEESPDKTYVAVDLPEALWEAAQSWTSDTSGILSSFHVEKLPQGGTKLILQAVNGHGIRAVEKATLEPYGEKGHRIYLDLVRE